MTTPQPEIAVWIERAGAQVELGDVASAAATAVEGLAMWPEAAPLWNLYGAMLLAGGRADKGVAALERAAALDATDPEPLRNLLGVHMARNDWEQAQNVIGRLMNLTPGEADLVALRLDVAMRRMADGQSCGWILTRTEGQDLQEARDALVAALDAGTPPEALPAVAAPVFLRLLDYDALERLGTFRSLGRRWACENQSRNLLMQLPRARRTREDRLEVLAQHRLWGDGIVNAAAERPVTVSPRAPAGRIRLGFISADLRAHAVGAFAWPLFEHLDRDRFDVHVYSCSLGEPDAIERDIAGLATAYRHLPRAETSATVQAIAADGLDVLFELGGPTGSNRIEFMAHRLAPIQASWLGYPHSIGLSTIDYLLLDRLVAPPDPALLIEAPLLMPRSWIVMGDHYFKAEPRQAVAPPLTDNGFVTFGTANSSYKYSQACMDLWGRVLAAIPDSRFLFIRPEVEAPTFRSRALAAFAAHGVTSDRIRFEAVRGGHLPFYDQMDISLDTLPLTGGTTTCESLWMGVPVVSLVGEALYERLSYSILTNAGLGDLAVASVDDYVATAVSLAADVARLTTLRAGLRGQIRSGPLGDAKGFARDFYDLVAATVAAHRAA